MEQYASNSHKMKSSPPKPNERRTIQPVVNSSVKKRDSSPMRTFIRAFIEEDRESVTSFLINDLVIPRIKGILHDGIVGIADFYFGSYNRGGTGTQVRQAGYHERYRSQNQSSNTQIYYSKSSSSCSYDELIFGTRGDAEIVLQQMRDDLAMYGCISILDMYDYAGHTPATQDFGKANIGWVNLDNAKVLPTVGGFYISLPVPKKL